ncbi:MAG: SDR family oxidoreductase [Pseudomonadota bacterium]
MDKRFSGKTAVITGASGGIGAAIAKRFADEGANVVVSAIDDRVEAIAQALREDGANAEAMVADVSLIDEVKELYKFAENKFGEINISIQNAGVITIAKIEDMTESEWDLIMDVNTKGVFLCCQEAIACMRKHGNGGALINTASGQARQGFIYTPHYAASKFGVVGVTQSLAKEVAKEQITVNAICPGIIDTDMWSYNDEKWGELLGGYEPGGLMNDWVEKQVPIGRVGTGEDVAGLVVFLASRDAAYITGQTINVDGGLIMS